MRSRSKRVADLASALFSEHALYQMSRRVLTIDQVRSVLASPEEVSLLREGRIVVHGFISMGEPARTYLLRVVVDVDPEPPVVVTVYKTSKISKYRSRA
jgi:hypothetical protein